MTLRDYFAGQALAGLCASHSFAGVDLLRGEARKLVAGSYFMADAMLAEREEGGSK